MEQYKRYLINGFTQGRTESSRELTDSEFDQIINYLDAETEKSLKRMRRKVLSIAHELGWEDEKGNVRLDVLDAWLEQYTAYKVAFWKLTYDQLIDIITQMEKFSKKEYEKFNNSRLKN